MAVDRSNHYQSSNIKDASVINKQMCSPSALVALGLMYLKTNLVRISS